MAAHHYERPLAMFFLPEPTSEEPPHAAVEYGGVVMLRIVRGRQTATDFQKAFARSGHAHAGVLVVFALVAQLLVDVADLTGFANFLARNGIWIAAVLFPAGFFLSSAALGATDPNRLIWVVYAG
jgi:hypothetical protein